MTQLAMGAVAPGEQLEIIVRNLGRARQIIVRYW
tara:strand:+ start:258 stop:359 length:102 start_codon:yes stop_codon:yes gene_type:complete